MDIYQPVNDTNVTGKIIVYSLELQIMGVFDGDSDIFLTFLHKKGNSGVMGTLTMCFCFS